LTEFELPFLQQHAGGPFKVTLPSPNVFAWGSYQPGTTDRVYSSRQELHDDAVDIIRREMIGLARAGVSYLQLDEGFNRHVTASWRTAQEQHGLDPAKLLANDIAMENRCYDA